MSHVASCDLVIKNLDILKRVVKEMGGTFVENKSTYKWYGKFLNDWNSERAAVRKGIDPKDYGKCVHVIRPPGWREGDYEVGVAAAKGGGFQLIYDNYSTGAKIEKAFGADCDNLSQNYASELVYTTLKAAGHSVTRTKEGGKVKIKALAF